MIHTYVSICIYVYMYMIAYVVRDSQPGKQTNMDKKAG